MRVPPCSLPLESSKLLLACDAADSLGSLGGVGFPSMLRSSNVSGICGGKPSLSFSLLFWHLYSKKLLKHCQNLLVLDPCSCYPATHRQFHYSLMSRKKIQILHYILSDLAGFDLPLRSSGGNTTVGDDMVG